MKIDVLGVFINNITMEEATKISLSYLYTNNKNMIFTPNPEFIINAREDKIFKDILNKSSLNIPDGIGVLIGAKILGFNLKERVAGFDLVQNIFENIKNTDKTVYFLGASESIVNKALKNMTLKYKGLNIVGARSGYFEDNNDIINEINKLKPDLLLVGLGSPKQEKWIYENKDKLNVKLMIGVGGSFDVMSGDVKRAPKIFIKLNLEWFYRLLKNPTRFKRILKLPLFILLVIKHRLKI